MERVKTWVSLWRYGAFIAAYLMIAGLTVFGGSQWVGGGRAELPMMTARR